MALDTASLSTPAHYGVSQTAVLLLDFHTLFVDVAGGPKAPEALATASRFRIWAKSQGIAVIHALIDVDALPLPTCKSVDRLPGILEKMKLSEYGGEAEVLVEGFERGGREIRVLRTPGVVGALESTGLLDFLRKNGIKSLVLAGLSTAGCVLSTTLAATDDGYVVTVISDGCADADEGVHTTLVTKVLPSRAYTMTALDFQGEFEGWAQLRHADK